MSDTDVSFGKHAVHRSMHLKAQHANVFSRATLASARRAY